jgi:hypothetical protein
MFLKRFRILLERLLELREQHAFFLALGLLVEDLRVLRRLVAQVHEQRRIAAVVEDHVGALAVAPVERAVDEVPVLLERLAFVGEHGRAARGNGRGRVVLRREHVTARPADLRAERLQRLDEHGRLDRHVQRARDARALEGLLRAELGTRGHEPRHLVLGKLDLLAAVVRQGDVLDVVVVCYRAHGPCLLRHCYLLNFWPI